MNKLLTDWLYYHKDDVAIAEMNQNIVKSKSDLTHVADKSLRKMFLPAQKHRGEARVIAERKWIENPNLTIADMVRDREIFRVYDDKMYKHKTLRGWINDLCPNKKRGRRKKL